MFTDMSIPIDKPPKDLINSTISFGSSSTYQVQPCRCRFFGLPKAPPSLETFQKNIFKSTKSTSKHSENELNGSLGNC